MEKIFFDELVEKCFELQEQLTSNPMYYVSQVRWKKILTPKTIRNIPKTLSSRINARENAMEVFNDFISNMISCNGRLMRIYQCQHPAVFLEELGYHAQDWIKQRKKNLVVYEDITKQELKKNCIPPVDYEKSLRHKITKFKEYILPILSGAHWGYTNYVNMDAMILYASEIGNLEKDVCLVREKIFPEAVWPIIKLEKKIIQYAPLLSCDKLVDPPDDFLEKVLNGEKWLYKFQGPIGEYISFELIEVLLNHQSLRTAYKKIYDLLGTLLPLKTRDYLDICIQHMPAEEITLSE